MRIWLGRIVLVAMAAVLVWGRAGLSQGPGAAQGAGAASSAPQPLPFVSPLFADHMVLQRGKLNTIWGWSEPGDRVTVTVGKHTATGVAGADRRWQVKVEPPAVGGPYEVQISGHETVELHDVLVGDVWLCGGQSNMEFALKGARNGAEEVKAADHPEIRFFTVFGKPAYKRVDVVGGTWKVVSPETADRFRRWRTTLRGGCRRRFMYRLGW